MYDTSDEYRRLIREDHTAVAYLDVQTGGTAVEQFQVNDGMVRVEIDTATRRSVDLEILQDDALTYEEMYELLDPLTSIFRPYRGIVLSDGSTEAVPCGDFYLRNLRVGESNGVPTFRITGYDASSRCMRGLPAPIAIASGTKFVNAIPPLLRSQLPGLDFRIGETEWVTPSLLFREESVPWTEAKNLAVANGQDLWIARDGVCETSVRPTQAKQVPDFTYVEGENSTFWDPERAIEADDFPNHVVVLGNGSTASNVRGEAYDNDPASETYINGKYGDRVYTVRSELPVSEEQATAMAKAILARRLGGQEEVTLSAIPDASIDEADTVSVTRERLGLVDRRMLVSSASIPMLATREMQVTCRRTIVSDGLPMRSIS